MLDNSPHHSANKTVRACGGTAAASPANPFSSRWQYLQKGYNVLWGKTCGSRQAFNEIGKSNPEPILLNGSRDRKSFGFGTWFFFGQVTHKHTQFARPRPCWRFVDQLQLRDTVGFDNPFWLKENSVGRQLGSMLHRPVVKEVGQVPVTGLGYEVPLDPALIVQW